MFSVINGSVKAWTFDRSKFAPIKSSLRKPFI